MMLFGLALCGLIAAGPSTPLESRAAAATNDGGRGPQDCPSGQQLAGDLGLLALQCDCTVNRSERAWQFRGEPVVREVDPNGPAAGRIQPGDTILSIDGVSLVSAEGGKRFGGISPGQQVRLGIRRNGRPLVVDISAQPLCTGDPRSLFARAPLAPDNQADVRRPAAAPAAPGGSERQTSGGSTVPAPPFPLPRYGFALACTGCGWSLEAGDPHPVWESRRPPRVHQVEPGGPADRAGIRPGDILTHIDGISLATETGGRRFGAVEPGQSVPFTVQRNGGEHQVIVVPQPPIVARAPRAPQRPRFEGVIGNVSATVHSADPVKTTVAPNGDEIVIETPTVTVRLTIRKP